jgi:hypothetical protein
MLVRQPPPVARLASELAREVDGLRYGPRRVAAEPFEQRAVDRDVAQRRRLIRSYDRYAAKLTE